MTQELTADASSNKAEAAPPQRVVIDQPLPVLNERHTTPYLSFAINTKNIGPGRFVLRLLRKSGDQPADEVPGAVPFEVVGRKRPVP